MFRADNHLLAHVDDRLRDQLNEALCVARVIGTSVAIAAVLLVLGMLIGASLFGNE